MRQDFGFGQHLLVNADLVHEATEGLAPLIRREIWQGLAQLKANGHAILIIDKNLDALMQIADRHCIMQNGRVVWHGRTAALAAAKEIKSRYLGV